MKPAGRADFGNFELVHFADERHVAGDVCVGRYRRRASAAMVSAGSGGVQRAVGRAVEIKRGLAAVGHDGEVMPACRRDGRAAGCCVRR